MCAAFSLYLDLYSQLLLVPVVIFFLIVQRNIATGLTAGAVKG